MGFEICIAEASNEVSAVQSLWREYWAALGLGPDFQDFANEMQSLPGAYGPPGGLLLIARYNDKPVGTIALRGLTPPACEAKRLFVRPEFRGQGLGRILLGGLIERARAMGYARMYADSLPSMIEAQTIYQQLGFRRTEPYSSSPTPGAIYLERSLRRAEY
jgi:putative acetyltransferase